MSGYLGLELNVKVSVRKIMVPIAVALVGGAGLNAMAATLAPMGLAPYYVTYGHPSIADISTFPLPADLPPEVHVVGGATDPAAIVTVKGSFYSVDRMVALWRRPDDDRQLNPLGRLLSIRFADVKSEPCGSGFSVPISLMAGRQDTVNIEHWKRGTPGPEECSTRLAGESANWTFQDTITYGAPVRRKASDGSEYDASPMVIKRGGVPWMTYYWGYRLGLVASESNWNPSDQSKVPMLADWPSFPSSLNNFELAKLPPPFIEGEIVEYVNYTVSPASPVGHFFYASNANEQALLDQVPQWTRTGRSFKSGGYVSVCRFYGSVSPGPNTHFYSADANECKVVLPGISALHDEGLAFRASRPIPATPSRAASCPTATIPLYRLYNNPAGRSFDSNHRYLTDDKIAQAMVSAGWVHEGLVMCVPQ